MHTSAHMHARTHTYTQTHSDVIIQWQLHNVNYDLYCIQPEKGSNVLQFSDLESKCKLTSVTVESNIQQIKEGLCKRSVTLTSELRTQLLCLTHLYMILYNCMKFE